MKTFFCKGCGSNELFEENGYLVCKYCGTKHLLAEEDKPQNSTIDLAADVERLLQRCKEDPARAQTIAQRILEIDPNNLEAKRILGVGNSSGGCYIATAVYGSYDCPEVWILRRYRDFTLANTWYGRAFICAYYAISPTLVKWFGMTAWFKNLWKLKLDRMVARLQAEGYDNSSYNDRNWKMSRTSGTTGKTRSKP